MSLACIEIASREIAALAGAKLPFAVAMRRMMAILKEMIPCETVNVGTVDLRTEEGFHFALDGFLMPPDRRALLPMFKHQHPMLEYARVNGLNPPLRFTDFHSRRQFEEIPLYRECYRGFTHSMLTFGVEAPAGINVSFVFSRDAREFSDAEQQMLRILQPLVSLVIRNLVVEATLRGSRRHGRPVGTIIGKGPFILNMDEHAFELLSRHYPNAPMHRLPVALWMQARSKQERVWTIKSDGIGGSLRGSITRTEEEWVFQLWDEPGGLSALELSALGMTGRQIEVLEWVSRGKTNTEIGLILGISYRTVQKHIEAIYRKLGVETRLSAVARCRELANSC